MKLKNFLEGYEPNTKDEDRFIKKHKIQKHADRNGNGDDVFQATNIKKIDRADDRHGYNPGHDEKVYEELEQLEEVALKPGQKVHRQELAKLIRKANPHIDPTQAYAMAVATAERVDESEQLDELSKDTMKSYVDKASNDRTKQTGDERKYDNRMKGTSKAVSKMKNEVLELEEAASPTAGTKLVSKHEGKDGYHAEIRHNKDWGEYQVHHYHNGKHLGEGPVSYHDDKADAKETAAWCVKNNCVKDGKVVTEEVEQIDELSKGKMKEYVRRAVNDVEDRAYWAGKDSDPNNPDAYADYPNKTQDKRIKGIGAAVKKLAKEEAEQLDELSKNALKSYRHSAMDDLTASTYHRRAKNMVNILSDKEAVKVGSKRIRGLDMVDKKLTKEDIINNAIRTYLPEAPMSPEDVFESRVERLGEGHRNILSNLFETLSDTNKIAMLEQMSTIDGVNELLDFAIQARNV